MKIKYRKKHENRTSKYLAPCLIKSYGKVFEMKIKELFILAFGIGDRVIENNPNFDFKNKSPIFVLIDTFAKKRKSEDFLYWIKYQNYFLYSYPIDIEGRGYMIILDFPNKKAYNKFLEGKYSEMYSIEEIKKYFQEDTKEYKVLTKDKVLIPDFIKNLKELFDIDNVRESDLKNFELDFPYTINKDEEIF